VSAQSTWRALDEAGEARTAANRPAFLPQTLAFGAQTFFWPCNLPQERYNFVKPVSKKEIPDEAFGEPEKAIASATDWLSAAEHLHDMLSGE